MNTFEQLQAHHEKLLAQQESETEILDQVRDYIAQARRAGSQVVSPQERDQLRANLRYWSGYVYEHTGVYPNTELVPAARDLEKDNARWLSRYGWLMVIAVVVIGVLAIIVGLISFFIPGPVIVPTITPEVTATVATTIPVQTVTPLPPSTPTHAPTPTATPTATPPPTPEPPVVSTLDPISIAVELASLQDGEAVRPQTAVSGSYHNLRPGWSIHILLQPISQAGRFFPAEQFETISTATPSGSWSIDVSFGEGAALEQPEQYNIRLVVATDDAGRDRLQEAIDGGLDEIPAQLLLFPQVITVSRSAYYHINEIRLVYAEFSPRQQNYELVTTRPDGSDRRQLTFMSGVSKFDPHISPSGRQIVYIQRETVDDTLSNSIWVMSSDGQNQTQLLADPETVYERPVWSPDGRYIAYSATVSRRFSQIFLYDLFTGDITQLTANSFNSRFPSWLPTGEALIYNSFTPVPGSPEQFTQALFLLDIESQESSLLFDDPAAIETHPAVSPDGTQVAYTSVRERIIREIFVLNLATLETRQLTTGGNDQFPRWHPDSETIYFESSRATIWAVDTAGPRLRGITEESETGHITPDSGFLEAFLPLE